MDQLAQNKRGATITLITIIVISCYQLKRNYYERITINTT